MSLFIIQLQMRERMGRMWPFSWYSSPPGASRTLYMANTTASLQHNPLYKIFLDATWRPLISTNTFMNDNTALHSWNYMLIMWSYAVSAVAFGLTSVLSLPDPETLARIDEERQQAAEQQLDGGQGAFGEMASPSQADGPPPNDGMQSDDIMRSTMYQSHITANMHNEYSTTKRPNILELQTQYSNNIDRQSSYVSYGVTTREPKQYTGISEMTTTNGETDEKKEGNAYPGPNKYNNYPPNVDEYVYPGPNKYNNHPPDLNERKSDWALKIYAKFMRFYNYQRQKLNAKFPDRPNGTEIVYDKSLKKPQRYRNRPYTLRRPPHPMYYRQPGFRRPMYRQPYFKPVMYVPQPTTTGYSSESYTTPVDSSIIYQHQSDEKPMSHDEDTWMAVTPYKRPPVQHQTIYKQQSEQESRKYPFYLQSSTLSVAVDTPMEYRYQPTTEQTVTSSIGSSERDPIGYQRIPEQHSLYRHSSTKSTYAQITSSKPPAFEPTDVIHSGFQRMPHQHSLLQQISDMIAKYRQTTLKPETLEKPKSLYPKSEDIQTDFQKPALHSLYRQVHQQTTEEPGKSYFKSSEDIQTGFQEPDLHSFHQQGHQQTTEQPAFSYSKSDEDIPIGFQEPDLHSLHRQVHQQTTEEPAFSNSKSGEDIPIGFQEPDLHSLHRQVHQQTTEEPGLSYFKSGEAIPIGFQEPNIHTLHRQVHQQTTEEPGLSYVKSGEDISVGFQEPNFNSLIQKTEQTTEVPEVLYSQMTNKSVVLSISPDEEIPIGFQDPENYSLYQLMQNSNAPALPTTEKPARTYDKPLGIQTDPKPQIHHIMAEKAVVSPVKGKNTFNALYEKMFEHFSQHQEETESKQPSKLRIEPAKLFSVSHQTIQPETSLENAKKAQSSIEMLQPVYAPAKSVKKLDPKTAPTVPVRRDGVQFVRTTATKTAIKEEGKQLQHNLPYIKLPEYVQLTESAEKIYTDWLGFYGAHVQGF